MQSLIKYTLSLCILFIFNISLAQVDLEQVKKDIEYLSSDALEGRQTGSPGEELSAQYIAKRFKDLKLKKINKSYFQDFSITQLRIARNETSLSFTSDPSGKRNAGKFKLNRDFYLLTQTANQDSAFGRIVDLGYGIVSESEKRNDFAAYEDLKGKVFFIRIGYPGMDENPHSPLADVCSVSQKIENALKYEPAAIIFLPGDSTAERPKSKLDNFSSTKQIPIAFMSVMSDGPPNGLFCAIKSDVLAPEVTAHNVAGYRNYHKRRTIVIVAHHDHIGLGEYGNSRHTGSQEIHNGADDNASGVATMLELARTLKGRKYCKNNYLFLAVSGEELGLLGSKFFVNHPLVRMSKINYVINIDMLGRLDTIKNALIINGTGTSPNWDESILNLKYDTNNLKIVKSKSGLGPSDHTSFYLKDIPVLHFFSGQHDDYHKPSDDAWKINYEGMDKSIDIIKQMVRLNNKKKKLPFTKTKDVAKTSRKWKVSLGIMPDYAFEGTGLRIDGVTEGRPASKASLESGDVIIQMGEMQIVDIYDYMKALGKLNKGDALNVKVIRNGNEITEQVNFL